MSENHRVIAKKRVIVNDPLDIHRVRFYQASWGMTEDFRSAKIAVAGREIDVKQGEIRPIEGTPFSLRANHFFPTFDIDPAGRPTSRDYEGRNPALQVDFLRGDKIEGRVWLLKQNPHVAFGMKDGRVFRTAPPPFRFLDIDPILFSGIQVGYDPGAPIFWFGAIVLLIGLSGHFYLHQRRLRLLVVPNGEGSRVFVGGWNSRAPQDFQAEFTSWVAGLSTAIAARESDRV